MVVNFSSVDGTEDVIFPDINDIRSLPIFRALLARVRSWPIVLMYHSGDPGGGGHYQLIHPHDSQEVGFWTWEMLTKTVGEKSIIQKLEAMEKVLQDEDTPFTETDYRLNNWKRSYEPWNKPVVPTWREVMDRFAGEEGKKTAFRNFELEDWVL
jgi:hypothetical protein